MLVLLGVLALRPFASHAGPRVAASRRRYRYRRPTGCSIKFGGNFARIVRRRRTSPIRWFASRRSTTVIPICSTATPITFGAERTIAPRSGAGSIAGPSRGTLEFLRPSFNEPWDPGPPTADLFEPAPAHPHNNPREFVPTPEPSGNLPPVIASVTVLGEFDYRVTRVADEGDLIHVSLQARRDPDRNRLRELFVDRKTLELQRSRRDRQAL